MKNRPKKSIQRQQRKQARLKIQRARKQSELKRQRQAQRRNVVYQMYRIIQRFFPKLFDWMREIEDYRRKPEYELAAILIACIAVFLFKAGSRNELNNMRDDPKFCKNYEKIFKLKLPHLDCIVRQKMTKLPGFTTCWKQN